MQTGNSLKFYCWCSQTL